MRTQSLQKNQLRDAIAKTVKMMAKDSIKVTQQGSQAFCSFDAYGKVKQINLPVIPDAPTPEFMIALQGFLDHEVAHALLTDGKVGFSKTTLTDDEKREAPNLHKMTNVVEDTRIESEISKIFPGAAVNLEALREFMCDTLWGKWVDQYRATALPEAEMNKQIAASTFVPYMRARAGQKVCQRFMDEKGLWPVFARRA